MKDTSLFRFTTQRVDDDIKTKKTNWHSHTGNNDNVGTALLVINYYFEPAVHRFFFFIYIYKVKEVFK